MLIIYYYRCRVDLASSHLAGCQPLTGLVNITTQGWDVKSQFIDKVCIWSGAPCCHVGDYLLSSVCGDVWFNLCTQITQCAIGVQPHLA